MRFIKSFMLLPEEEADILENLLIKNKPQVLTPCERKVLRVIAKRGLPERYRRPLWLRASGATAMMSRAENKDYYRRLKKMEMDYPNPSFSQIELDLGRTFTELKINQTVDLINKLRNVLYTFVKRNPTIGYCQGMNFLVARLLKMM